MIIKNNKVGKDNLDLLTILTIDYLQNEENFLIFEETVFPGNPGTRVTRERFKDLRSNLARRASKQPSPNPVVQLQGINSSAILQKQTSTLQQVETTNFKIREKVDTVTRDIENLKIDVDLKFEGIADNLDQELNNINNKLDLILNKLDVLNNLEDYLTNLINDNFKKLKEFIQKVIGDSLTDLKNFITDCFAGLYNFLKTTVLTELGTLELMLKEILAKLTNLSNNLNRNFNNLITKVNENTNRVKSNLRSYIYTQLLEQTAGLNTSFSLELASQFSYNVLYLVGAIEGELSLLVGELTEAMYEVINSWYQKQKSSIFEGASSYVCKRIVGESYIKYDANYMYMPTIILKYKTKNRLDERKYSQIKLRLDYKTEEITDTMIKELKLKLQAISLITYTCGTLRCNYVSEKRLFKTTVFSSSKETVFNLFKNIISLTNTVYLEKNFSFTENSRRDHNLRRKQGLENIKINKFNNFSEVEMCLSSAYLQVNGLENQIELF